ncbi:hypothetical protein ABZ814_17835 [Micromonospora musae]|uniref:hypothetical protein n=1 Tax=Micromonospora musae TaxID=1894970 RepID=UPI0033DF0FAF
MGEHGSCSTDSTTSLAIGPDEAVLPDGFPIGAYRRAAEGGRELLAAYLTT